MSTLSSLQLLQNISEHQKKHQEMIQSFLTRKMGDHIKSFQKYYEQHKNHVQQRKTR